LKFVVVNIYDSGKEVKLRVIFKNNTSFSNAISDVRFIINSFPLQPISHATKAGIYFPSVSYQCIAIRLICCGLYFFQSQHTTST
jgi:hypothetical protein